ncbi:MAG: type IX secretion system protein PorQ [Vicingaceae bacterium]
MKPILAVILFLLFYGSSVHGQIGGKYAYQFLDLSATSRITGMGGNMIAFRDDDPGSASDNPSLLQQNMDRTAVLSYMNYFDGINQGFASYTFHKEIGTFNTAIKYLDYGQFREADAGNNELGTFSANEVALIGGYGRQIDSSFSVGANVKFIYSNYYLLNSVGLALDLSATYELKKSLFLATMVIKNIGSEIKPYVPGERHSLPFDIQFGISKSFNKMPFRFSLVMHQLGKGRLTYPPLEQNTGSTFGEEEVDRSQSTAENILRHFIIGTEFIPFKGLNFQIAYNFQRRKEMAYSELPKTVGLSWGLGLKISKFRFNYARSSYHLAGSPNHITVLTRFDDWAKK